MNTFKLSVARRRRNAANGSATYTQIIQASPDLSGVPDASVGQRGFMTPNQVTNLNSVCGSVKLLLEEGKALKANIEAEATVRAQADTALQAKIEAEATARAQADTAFQKFEAQVAKSDKGVFFTEKNGIEARLGKGLTLDDNNAIAINDNVVVNDDYAPKLTAGFADNLVGRGEATPETISFRQSAGNISIEDGTARIVKLKGNSVYWTQLAEQSDVTLSKGSTLVSDNNYRAYTGVRLSSVDITHKYLVFCKVVCTDKDGLNPLLTYSLYNGTGKASFQKTLDGSHSTNGLASAFFTPKDASYNYVGFYCRQKDTIVNDDKEWSMYVQVHDLTLMFGAGNEPTTTAVFLSRTQYFAGKSHNPGEYIHLKANAIKTVGLNAWEEKWTVNPSQGSVYSNVYVPVVAGERYFFSSTREDINNFYVSVILYDKNKQKIGNVPNGIYFNTSKNNANFNNPYTIPADVAYISFNITPAYGAEYKNDICIHLAHTGYKNGTYEPYKEFIRKIPIADIKDSNGAQLFPEGLCSIGENVYDEITPTKAIKRVGVVDLGDLTWDTSGTSGGETQPLMLSRNFKGAVFAETANVKANILCAKYQTYTATQIFIQNVGVGLGDKTQFPHLYLYDPNFTDAATFKSAMKGVKMYFQLAEPIEVKFDEPLNLDYQVWDFGTESVVSDGATAPLRADIIYQFNAVDRIRENRKAIDSLTEEVATKQQELTLTVLDNGNIRIGNLQGQTKDFMPATPSGDPMHYAYETLGAVYNDTDEVIIRKGFFNEDVEHKPRCWYLNYLGDLSNEDMQRVYQNASILPSVTTGDANINARTLIRVRKSFFVENGTCKYQHYIESFPVMHILNYSVASDSVIKYAFYNYVDKIKVIFPEIRCSTNTSFYNNCFHTPKLEHIKLRFLQGNVFFHKCPLISKQSILYLINNSGAGKDFVVTLHADAYARLIDDADIQTALTAHPNVSLASA